MMIKSKAALLLAVAVSASVPTTRVFAYEPPTRVSLIQQHPAVQKEKLPSHDLFAQNKPVSPNAPPPSETASDAMVWRISWISNRDDDFKDRADGLAREGWEPFAMATFPVSETRRGDPVDVYYIFFAYRKKFPKSFVP